VCNTSKLRLTFPLGQIHPRIVPRFVLHLKDKKQCTLKAKPSQRQHRVVAIVMSFNCHQIFGKIAPTFEGCLEKSKTWK